MSPEELKSDLRQVARTPGWLSLDEAELLYKTVLQLISGCVVEVGSYRGRSTVALALAARRVGGTPVYAVDPHVEAIGQCGGVFGPEDRAAFFRSMLRTKSYKVVRLINLSSEIIKPGWTEPVSFLWIDGDHSYQATRRDIDCWLGHLTADARVAFHDTLRPELGPARVIRELLESGVFVLHAETGSMRVLRKCGD